MLKVHTHARMHTRTHAHTHARTHANTHACMHTHTHTKHERKRGKFCRILAPEVHAQNYYHNLFHHKYLSKHSWLFFSEHKQLGENQMCVNLSDPCIGLKVTAA